MTRRGGWAAGAALLLSGVALVVAGTHRWWAPDPRAVSGGGFTLASTSVALPEDAEHLPPGHATALLEANCTGCHSAGMILTQPPLKPAQWEATVTKMREVYKAPVDAHDVPAILDELAAISARKLPAPRPDARQLSSTR